jgi:hypothetical protein
VTHGPSPPGSGTPRSPTAGSANVVRRRVSTVAGTHENVFEIAAAPDSAYFIQLRPERFSWSVRFRPSLWALAPEEIRQALRRAHMVASSWPGTPLVISSGAGDGRTEGEQR